MNMQEPRPEIVEVHFAPKVNMWKFAFLQKWTCASSLWNKSEHACVAFKFIFQMQQGVTWAFCGDFCGSKRTVLKSPLNGGFCESFSLPRGLCETFFAARQDLTSIGPLSVQRPQNLGPSAEMCRGFLLYKFWRILPGIFLEDFSGHFFPQTWGEKIRRENPRKNPAAQKKKSAKNPFRQKPTLKNPFLKGFETIWGKNLGLPKTQVQWPQIQRPILGPEYL